MTRDDIFWILTRAAALWLFIEAVAEVPHLVTWIRLDTRFAEEGAAPISAILVRLFAAYALFEFDKRMTRSNPASGEGARGALQLSMRREDLLWVGLKLGGAYLAVSGMVAFFELLAFSLTEHFDFGSLLLVGTGGVALFAAGLWLLLSDRLWHMVIGPPREAPAPTEGDAS